jgi:meiotic recombination protein REC8
LSPHAAVSSALGSEHHLDPNLDLIIPPSSSAGGGGFGLGLGGTGLGDSDHNRGYSRSLFGGNEEGLLPDIDLGLGLDFEDGNIVDNATAPRGGRATSIHTPAPVMRDGVLPDSNGYQDVAMYDDEPLPVYQDDIDMQDAEPFAPRTAAQQADPSAAASVQEDQAQSQTSSTTATAPAVRTRIPKPLPQDQELELHNSDLQTWDREYLATQLRAAQQKLQNKTLVLARKNAAYWVLQNGIGGLGFAYQGVENHMPEPLRMFSGTALLEALTGIQLTLAGTKHPRDIDEDPEDEERRVRTRSNSHEQGRAGDVNDTGSIDTGFMDDTIANTIEQGRDAPTPLPDLHSSAHALPWNHAAPPSRASSHHTAFVPPYPVFGPGGVGASSSVAGGGGFSIRGRRTVSASPLVGRGTAPITAVDDLNFMQSIQSDAHDNFTNALPIPSAPAADDLAHHHPSFDLHGPAALVSTLQANTQSFLHATLTTESLNFLAFVKAAISEAKDAKETTIEAIASVLDVDQEETETEDEVIMFEVLLRPEANSRVVAAQGFLHVLGLVSRGLLGVVQERAFGGIEMRVL